MKQKRMSAATTHERETEREFVASPPSAILTVSCKEEQKRIFLGGKSLYDFFLLHRRFSFAHQLVRRVGNRVHFPRTNIFDVEFPVVKFRLFFIFSGRKKKKLFFTASTKTFKYDLAFFINDDEKISQKLAVNYIMSMSTSLNFSDHSAI